ncbi:MAG: hypothetical protein U0871_13655 [Gemmataceae bacterium]
MSTVTLPAAGAKPAGSVLAAPSPAQPDRKGKSQRRSCLVNKQLFALAALLERVRELAQNISYSDFEHCTCDECWRANRMHLVMAAELNAELVGSALDSGVVSPVDEPDQSADTVSGRTIEIVKYLRGLEREQARCNAERSTWKRDRKQAERREKAAKPLPKKG